MQEQRGKVLGTLSIVVAVIGLIVVVVTGAATFFGGTKLRPLFGMSEEALAKRAAEIEALDAQKADASVAAPVATP